MGTPRATLGPAEAAGVELAKPRHLGGVRTVTVRAGRLEKSRQPLECRVPEEHGEAFAHESVEHVRVTVAIRAHRCGGVVDVKHAKPLEADPVVDLLDEPRRGRADR